MIVLITGGAKSGKSSYAQDLAVKLAAGGKRYYLATMIPCDEEDRQRIRNHLADREGLDFQTVECGHNILSVLSQLDRNASFLLDSTTALLLNELFPDPTSCEMDTKAAAQCAEDVAAFSKAVANIVVVSDYIYSDACRYDEITQEYRKYLALIDKKVAAIADTVLEITAGQVVLLKGALPC